METIAFYSYKGGVGRSLLVANAARFLGLLGKRVVALDLDLEAPGLHYKLARAMEPHHKPLFEGGAVAYLAATAKSAKNPPALAEHLIELALPEGVGGRLCLIPAGPAPRREYWTMLKRLRERLRFDDPSGKGLAALLDLHARIQDELKPDYLLIDARTGVTELGGLATTALADSVVCLLVANQESVDGTIAIVEALGSAARDSKRKRIRIVPVVTRTTSEVPKDGRTAEGISRLVEIGEGQVGENKGKPRPFQLPHDDVVGATDMVVGGERKASAFSPLHKAYLQLFQHLFPQARTQAEDVLRRLEAVAGLRKQLTERPSRRSGARRGFQAWAESAIEEGVVLKSERDSKISRYADLVCRGDGGNPLVIVEYTGESKEAEVLEYWAKHSRARCVILLVRREKHTWTNTEIFCRSGGWNKEFQPADRHEPPAPVEFEIFENPGSQSVDEMLVALHRGNEDLVPEMIAQWRECMALGDGPRRGPGRWRPIEARRILDGLAATEKTDVAVRVLRHAARIATRESDYDDFEMRHGGMTSAALAAEELFAPLFWRLPIEAAIDYLGRPEHPGWSPCLAGHRLLAEDVMGLRYNPIRSALSDSGGLSLQDSGPDEDEGERAVHLLYRRLFHDRPVRVSDEVPPLLLWDQQLREHQYWSGDLDEIDDKMRDDTKKLVGDSSRLRKWLSARIAKGALSTSGLLGCYDAISGKLEVFPALLEALAAVLAMPARHLKSVVFIQLSVLALGHQASDLDGQPGFGFAIAPISPFRRESPVHIMLAQYFAFRLIERLGDFNLKAALEKLSDNQPEPYRRWRDLQKRPIEEMRTVLLRARLGSSTLGLSNQ